jgi:hypothetical protein
MKRSSLNFPARDGSVIKERRNDRTVGIVLLSITGFNPSNVTIIVTVCYSSIYPASVNWTLSGGGRFYLRWRRGVHGVNARLWGAD